MKCFRGLLWTWTWLWVGQNRLSFLCLSSVKWQECSTSTAHRHRPARRIYNVWPFGASWLDSERLKQISRSELLQLLKFGRRLRIFVNHAACVFVLHCGPVEDLLGWLHLDLIELFLFSIELSPPLQVFLLLLNQHLLANRLLMLSLLLHSELVLLKPFCNRCFVSHALRVLLELCPPLLFEVILSLCVLNDLLHPVVRFVCRGEEVLGS